MNALVMDSLLDDAVKRLAEFPNSEVVRLSQPPGEFWITAEGALAAAEVLVARGKERDLDVRLDPAGPSSGLQNGVPAYWPCVGLYRQGA